MAVWRQDQDRFGPRLLLFMEWPLLGNALIAELVVSRFRPGADPLGSVFCLLGLGAMRLWMPTRFSHRVIYTLAEFGLVFIPCLLGHFRIQFYIFPSLILVIRSCILFQREIRWLISAIAFGCFVILQFLEPVPMRFLLPLGARSPSAQGARGAFSQKETGDPKAARRTVIPSDA